MPIATAYRPAMQAKAAIQRVRGVHAVGRHKRRGVEFLDIVAVTRRGRTTREIPIYDGTVADATVENALRQMLGNAAALEYLTCY